MNFLIRRPISAACILLVSLFCVTVSSHEILLNYSIQYNKKEMPECLSEEKNPRNGIIIFYDKTSRVLPRKIFYSRLDHLNSVTDDTYFGKSLSSCRELRHIDTQKLVGTEINLDDTEIVLNQFKLNQNLIQRLLQLRNGHTRYFPYENLDDAKYLDFLNEQFSLFKKKTHKILLKDYGTNTTSKIYSDYIATKNYGSCESLIGACEYYFCQESKNPCGAKGYFVGFGYQYCSQSLELLLPKVSPAGKKWLVSTATCLQRKMNENEDHKTCSEIKEKAIETHSDCYNEVNFCTMKLSDILQVMKMIFPELTDKQVLKQGIAVLKDCRR